MPTWAYGENMIERVAIVGAGAMGGMYADHFARAGFEVSWIARGERAARLAATGLQINGSPLQLPVVAADQPGHVEPADLVIFAGPAPCRRASGLPA